MPSLSIRAASPSLVGSCSRHYALPSAACGLPVAHLHARNVLVRRASTVAGAPSHAGLECVLSEFELALLCAPTYAEQRQLAMPRLAVGATQPYSVSRGAVAFGHVLYEMSTGRELTEAELLRVGGSSHVPDPAFGGAAAAWSILEKIFLPRMEQPKGASLVELLAEPFFSVELPSAAASASAVAPSFVGRAATLLKASRKRYGGELLTVPVQPPAEVGGHDMAGGGSSSGGWRRRRSQSSCATRSLRKRRRRGHAWSPSMAMSTAKSVAWTHACRMSPSN